MLASLHSISSYFTFCSVMLGNHCQYHHSLTTGKERKINLSLLNILFVIEVGFFFFFLGGGGGGCLDQLIKNKNK